LQYYRDKLKVDIKFWKNIQYLFFEQWAQLREYANGKGIKIIGDMPIYTAFDSADVWANPQYFQLDKDLRQKKVAGVPPDYFSATGQIWGNPLYDWDFLKADGYKFWVDRLRGASKLYDTLRIDHFRGFADYFVIDHGAKTAAGGKWEKGPGMALFDKIAQLELDMEIIAEDLGELSPAVYKLLKDTGFPGMKILQFSLGGEDDPYLPSNYTTDNCVVYTGTHDNETTAAWYKALDVKCKRRLNKHLKPFTSGSIAHKMIEWAYSSRANTIIIPMQDILNFGAKARMNTPGAASGNWQWRMSAAAMSGEVKNLLLKLVESQDIPRQL